MAVVDIFGKQDMVLGQPAAPLQVTDREQAPFVKRQFPFGLYFERTIGWLPLVSNAIARHVSRWLERKRTMERNMDPRQADELLDEWEQLYDIDVPDGATLEDRREFLLASVRNLGGVTAIYYEGVATDFGYGDAVVTDAADPFTTISLCDDFLAGGEWKVTLHLTAASQGAQRDQQLQDLINGQLLAGWFAIYTYT